MVAQFDEAGIRFKYPTNWKLERDESDEGWTVSVQSPASAFLMLCCRPDRPTLEEVLDTALNAMEAEYPGLESEDALETLAGQPALGQNIRFFSLDLTNTCWLRSFYASQGTILVLCQCNDLESETNEQVLRAICASLEIDD